MRSRSVCRRRVIVALVGTLVSTVVPRAFATTAALLSGGQVVRMDYASDPGTVGGTFDFNVLSIDAGHDETGYLNVVVDLNDDGDIQDEEWVVQNVPVFLDDGLVAQPMLSAWFDPGEEGLEAGALYDACVTIDTEELTSVGALDSWHCTTAPAGDAVWGENDLGGQASLSPPPTSIGPAVTGEKKKFARPKRVGVPDIAQKQDECGPTSTANSLRWLETQAAGALKQAVVLPAKDDDLIKGLMKAMRGSDARPFPGLAGNQLFDGKKKYFTDNNLPLTVRGGKTDAGANGAKAFDFIAKELDEGADVEVLIAWPGGGSHWVTAVGYAVNVNRLFLEVNDPDDGKTATVEWELKRDGTFVNPKGKMEWAVSERLTAEAFGNGVAACDFNGDGFADLAIGVPNEDVGTGTPAVDAGAVNVLYGTRNGLNAASNQVWTQDTPLVQGSAEPGDHFGQALAAGDYDADGFCDLAIGVPGEDVGTIVDAGSVAVLYGGPSGLRTSGNQVWDQNKAGVEGSSEAGDEYGSSLASGDFNGDGFADLAIGVPGEDVGAVLDAGGVNVLYGTRSRLSAIGDQLWNQNVSSIEDIAEAGDHFGSALAAGDFDHDGFGDLSIGIPDEDVGSIADAGAVSVLYGSRRGLATTDDQVWNQNSANVEGVAQAGDRFGAALASGDFDGDGFADLAIGAPNEDVGGIVDAGAVNVLYGSATHLRSQGDQIWDQNRSNVEGTSQGGDEFGRALASGDFDHDGFADLAIGIPGEGVGAASSAGAVQILYGSPSRLSAGRDEIWNQSTTGIQDSAETGDHLGAALAPGDFNGDGFDDLAVGAPTEDAGTVIDAGAVNILYGAPGGISSANNQLWSQDTPGIEGEAE